MPRETGKGCLTGQARMEVVERAHLARDELVVEDGVVVEAAHRVQAAHVSQDLVERLLAREHELAHLLGVERREHRLADLGRPPDETGGEVEEELERRDLVLVVALELALAG